MNLASVGLTHANGERAVDMAQDLKKNVVNLWNTWFPTPSSTLASVGAGASGSSSEPLSSAAPLRSSTFSGSHTLSHHHIQSPRQPVAERPAKTVRMNSTSVLSSLGNSSSGPNASATTSAASFSTDPSSTTLASSSKHTRRRSNSASNRSKSPSLLAGLRSSTPHEDQEPTIEAASAPTSQSSQPRSNSPMHLMGKLYPPSPTQWIDFQHDFTKGLIWCTYRHSYAPIRPSSFSTDIISWFFDDMTSRSPFSVHRIALLGKQLGKNIGEWFGPSTTSQVIKALVDNYPESGLSVYVTTDGVIYKDQVEQTATMKGRSPFGNVLILATIRLGIDKVNPVYHNAIKATFELPQSLGIAGGRPSSSYYFVGYQDNDLFYLDPHHSRCMVEIKDLNQYTEENLATYHCDTIRKIDIGSVDPSMLIAFYCRDRAEFDVFCSQVQAMNELLKGDLTAAGQSMSAIIGIGERAPVYDSGDDMEGHLLTVADEEDEDLELVLPRGQVGTKEALVTRARERQKVISAAEEEYLRLYDEEPSKVSLLYRLAEVHSQASTLRKNGHCKAEGIETQAVGQKVDGLIVSSSTMLELCVIKAANKDVGQNGTKALSDTRKIANELKNTFDCVPLDQYCSWHI
ncbi:Cysteine protease atg4 [Actinomortierella ambigua]|nr:Cysteine protease atg4 [Actinomortierella ambigua]